MSLASLILGPVKVFVSSVVKGMEAERDAAARAITALGHDVGRSEDFVAGDKTPQQACLEGVRWADAVVLILGSRYGQPQMSGISATHEEYREARERRPVLVFVQDGVEREPDQASFVNEVESWGSGRITSRFRDAEGLRDVVTRALHDLELSMRAGDVDVNELLERARALVPESRHAYEPTMCLVVTGGPRQSVLRPSEVEDPALERNILREALLGDVAVLTPSQATDSAVRGNSLVLKQENGSVLVDDLGSVQVVQPATETKRGHDVGLPAIIAEVVQDRVHNAIAFAGSVLDQIDPVRRISAVVPLLALSGVGTMPWRTREEHAASPNSMSMPWRADSEVIVTLSPPDRARAALMQDTDRITEDLVALVRRQMVGRDR